MSSLDNTLSYVLKLKLFNTVTSLKFTRSKKTNYNAKTKYEMHIFRVPIKHMC